MKKAYPAFMKKLLLAGLVFSFALNGFTPRIDLGGDGSDFLVRIFSAHSALLQAFALTALPLEIVNSLMAGQTASAGEKTDSRPVNKDAQNPSSDYSLTSPAHRPGGAGYVNKHWRSPLPQAMVPLVSVLLSGVRDKTESPPGLPAGLFALVLAFFFLLPRSGLSDGWARIFASAGTRLPNVASRVGFFISRHFKRSVALVTLSCFIVTTMPWQGFASVNDVRQPASSLRTASGGFTIPSMLGKITDARYYGSKQVVINIQDLHCHPEVQRNISRIIALADAELLLKNVYQEGAAGQVDTSWLGAIQDNRLKQKLVESLLARGVITGAESYSVLSGKYKLLSGLENDTLYTENVLRLNELYKNREKINAAVGALKHDVSSLTDVYYGDKNRRFEKIIENNKAGALHQKKYHAFLKKYGVKLGIDIASYRNLSAYHALLETASRIDYPRVTSQLQVFVDRLKQHLPYRAFNSVLQKTDNFSQFDDFPLCFAQIKRDYPGAADIARDFPQLAVFFDYLEKGRALNPVMLVREEHKLVREIQLRLAESKSEREIVFLANFIRYLDDYLSNRISAEECAYVESNLDRFNLLWTKYGDGSRLSGFAPYMTILKDFYRVNRERNDCFLKSMPITGATDGQAVLSARSADGTDEEKILASLREKHEVMLTVMGGFHTEGFTELLRKQNISYIVITPAVTGQMDSAGKIYREAMQLQAQIPAQTIAVRALSQDPYDIQTRQVVAGFVSAQLADDQPLTLITEQLNAVLDALFEKDGRKVEFKLLDVSVLKDRYSFTITETNQQGASVVKTFIGSPDGLELLANDANILPPQPPVGGGSTWKKIRGALWNKAALKKRFVQFLTIFVVIAPAVLGALDISDPVVEPASISSVAGSVTILEDVAGVQVATLAASQLAATNASMSADDQVAVNDFIAVREKLYANYGETVAARLMDLYFLDPESVHFVVDNNITITVMDFQMGRGGAFANIWNKSIYISPEWINNTNRSHRLEVVNMLEHEITHIRQADADTPLGRVIAFARNVNRFEREAYTRGRMVWTIASTNVLLNAMAYGFTDLTDSSEIIGLIHEGVLQRERYVENDRSAEDQDEITARLQNSMIYKVERGIMRLGLVAGLAFIGHIVLSLSGLIIGISRRQIARRSHPGSVSPGSDSMIAGVDALGKSLPAFGHRIPSFASVLEPVVKLWFAKLGARHPVLGQAGYRLYAVLAVPVWEEAVFRLPLAFALLSGNVFGLGIAIGLSMAVFSAAHVIAQWMAQPDKADVLQKGRGWKDVIGNIRSDGVFYLAPSLVFTGIFIASAQFLPFGILGAYVAAVLAHSAWNTVVSIRDASARERARWMPMASIIPAGHARGSRQEAVKSDADIEADLRSALSNVIAERRREFGFEAGANVTVVIKKRTDNHDDGDRDSYHLTTLDVQQNVDTAGAASHTITLGVHQILWDALKNKAPPRIESGSLSRLVTEHEVDQWLALHRPDSDSGKLLVTYLTNILKAPARDLKRHVTSENFHNLIHYLSTAPKTQMDHLPERAQRIAGQAPLVRFARELVQLEHIIESFRTQHPEENPALIVNAFRDAVAPYNGRKMPSGKTCISHALDMAGSLARWGADDAAIAAALLTNLDTASRQRVLSKHAYKPVKEILRKYEDIAALPYLDGSVITTMGGTFTLQNYMNMIIQMAGNPQVLLLTFAEKLWGIPEAATPEEQAYRYQEMEHIYVTLAMRLNSMDIANDLRDGALALHDPAGYAKTQAEIEEILGSTYEEAEKELAVKGSDMAAFLKLKGISAPIVKTRVKSPYSIWEKIFGPRTDHKDVKALSDILGFHVIVADTSDVDGYKDEVGMTVSRIYDWIIEQGFEAPKTPVSTLEKKLGFESTKVNFKDKQGRLYEVRIFTRRNYYDAFSFGLINPETITPAIPHWIYKSGKKIEADAPLGTVVHAVSLRGQKDPVNQSFRSDNIRYTGTFFDKFNQLRDALQDRVFVTYLAQDRKSKSFEMKVLDLPRGSLPADAAAMLDVDRLDPAYGGMDKLIVPSWGSRRIDAKSRRQLLDEEMALTSGLNISVHDKEASGRQSHAMPLRIFIAARTPRAKLKALNLGDRDAKSALENGAEAAKAFPRALVESFMRSRGFRDLSELYIALATGIVERKEFVDYLHAKNQRVLTTYYDPVQMVKNEIPNVFSAPHRTEIGGIETEIRRDGTLVCTFSLIGADGTAIVSNITMEFTAAQLESMAARKLQDALGAAQLTIVEDKKFEHIRVDRSDDLIAFQVTVQDAAGEQDISTIESIRETLLSPGNGIFAVEVKDAQPLYLSFQALGGNVLRLISSLFEPLAMLSMSASQLLVQAFNENPVPVSAEAAEQMRLALAPLAGAIAGGSEQETAIIVEGSDNPALIREDAWALATLAVNKATKSVTIYVHRALLDAIRALPEDSRRQFLAMTALHEAYEYLALNEPASEIGRLFGRYIALKGKQSTAAAFHDYLESLAAQPLNALTAVEQSLIDQEKLLAFAETVAAAAAGASAGAVVNVAKKSMPAQLASAAAGKIAGRRPMPVPALAGKTVLHFVDAVDSGEAALMRGMPFNNIYVLPNLAAANQQTSFIGRIEVIREGKIQYLDLYAGTYGSASVLSVPGLLPHEMPALIAWLSDTPQLFSVLQDKLELPCALLDPVNSGAAYLIELNTPAGIGDSDVRTAAAVVLRGSKFGDQDRKNPGVMGLIDDGSLPVDETQKITAVFEAYAAAFTRKHAEDAVMPPGAVMGEAVRVSALREKNDDNDPGIGELTDIPAYASRVLAKVPEIRSIPLEPFTDPDAREARAGDIAVIDLSAVPEVQDLLKKGVVSGENIYASADKKESVDRPYVISRKVAVLQQAYALFNQENVRASTRRYQEYKSFVAQHSETWLGSYARDAARQLSAAGIPVTTEAVAYMQWLFFEQLSAAIRGQEHAFSFRIDVDAAAVAEHSAAIGYWFSAGFSGVRVQVLAAGALNEHTIARITDAITAARPDAVDMWRLPARTTVPSALAGKMIIRLNSEIAAGEKPGGTVVVELDPGVALSAEDAENAAEQYKAAAGMILPAGTSAGHIVSNDTRLPRQGDPGQLLPEGVSPLLALFKRVSLKQTRSPRALYRAGQDRALRLFSGVAVNAQMLTSQERQLLSARVGPGSIEPASVNSIISDVSQTLQRMQTADRKHADSLRAAQQYLASLRTPPQADPAGALNDAMALSGFIRGMMEGIADQGYRTLRGEDALLANPSDRAVMRTLLMVADSVGLDTEGIFSDTFAAHMPPASPVAKALGIIASKGNSTSRTQMEAEVRALINPLINNIIENASLPSDKLTTLKADQAVIAGLIRLLDMLADRKPASPAEPFNRSAVPAGALIRSMLSAA